jgi:hypothetical protein
MNVYYDLAVSPVSYDFLAFLVKARVAANAAGAEDLHVSIVPKTDGLGGFSRDWGGYDAEETRWRLWNIVLPACQLARATVSLLPDREGFAADGVPHHHAKELIQAGKIAPLSASPHAIAMVDEQLARFTKPVITVTIRETNDTARNSNAPEWQKFWGSLEGRFGMIWLPDARRAMQASFGAVVQSIDLRAALYQRAAMNLFVANGPSALAWYTGAPFMQFCCGSVHGESWAKHWEWLGLPDGKQLPWARTDQRLIYERDTFENISRHFERWADGAR